MTIYECLGVDSFLLDEMIPIELIIENIERLDQRYDAQMFFKDIVRVSLRASLNRGNHYLQVIEVELSKTKHINEISFLIQKAIKYQILFVFVYEERYLLLRRSFNLTESTENVTTSAASYTSDWIYKEYLEDDLVCYFQMNELGDHYDEEYELPFIPKQAKNDNGDYKYFLDLLKNVAWLNWAVVNGDVVCLRFLLDWFKVHAAGSRLEAAQVLDEVRRSEAYQMIGEYLFIEKNCIRNAISELEGSKYTISLDHTGKNPMQYFNGVDEPVSYSEASRMMSYVLYGKDNPSDYDMYDIVPPEAKEYSRHSFARAIPQVPGGHVPSRLGFIDQIIRGYYAGKSKAIKDQFFSAPIKEKLMAAGYSTIIDLKSVDLKGLEELTKIEKIDLLYYLDARGIRTNDCKEEHYPKIEDYIQMHYRCEECGGILDVVNWNGANPVCSKCKARAKRTENAKLCNTTVTGLRWNEWLLSTELRLNIIFQKGQLHEEDSVFILKSVCILTENLKPVYPKVTINANVGLCQENAIGQFVVTWEEPKSLLKKSTAKYLHVVIEEEATEECFLYVFSFDSYTGSYSEWWKMPLYDYQEHIDYSKYAFDAGRHENQKLIDEILENQDTRASVEKCLENLDKDSVRSAFDSLYTESEGLYFNKQRTKLIAYIPKESPATVFEIPEGVMEICAEAFPEDMTFESISFPYSLRTIGYRAFYKSTFACELRFRGMIFQIDREAFGRAKTSLPDIYFDISVPTVGGRAFPTSWRLHFLTEFKNVSTEIVDELTTKINNKLYFGVGDEPVVLISDTNNRYTWKMTSENMLTIKADGNLCVHGWDFDEKKEWQQYAHRIKVLTFSEGIESISGNLFSGCECIRTVIFPKSLKYIDATTFRNTHWYQTITNEFEIIGDGCLIKVYPYDKNMTVPDRVKFISQIQVGLNSDDLGYRKLQSLKFGPNVVRIFPYAFANVRSLNSVLLNEGLEEIGDSAFEYCTNIKFVCLPNSVTKIDADVFHGCSSLRCVALPEQLQTINGNVFRGCEMLQRILVPFSEDELRQKVQHDLPIDAFPYDKCEFNTLVTDRNIRYESQLKTAKASVDVAYKKGPDERPLPWGVKGTDPIQSLKNIGLKLTEQLNTVGVLTVNDLFSYGTEELWMIIYSRFGTPDCYEINAIECAKRGISIKFMDGPRRNELKQFVRSIKNN